MQKDTVAVRLELPWPMHCELKAEASHARKTLKDLLMEILENHLRKENPSGTNPNG